LLKRHNHRKSREFSLKNGLKLRRWVPLIVMRMEIALEVREREQEMYLWSLREKLQNGALPF
jgi:hypothetical protein